MDLFSLWANVGKWLEFGEEVRIKHIPSQKYIAVKDVDGKVSGEHKICAQKFYLCQGTTFASNLLSL